MVLIMLYWLWLEKSRKAKEKVNKFFDIRQPLVKPEFGQKEALIKTRIKAWNVDTEAAAHFDLDNA